MNEKPEKQSNPEAAGEERPSPGVHRKPARSTQPSFEDVMQAATAPKPAPAQPPRRPAPEVKKPSAQPSFEEIMSAVVPAPAPAPSDGTSAPEEAASASPAADSAPVAPPRSEQAQPPRRQQPRPPRKEERKLPVVIRKIPLSQLQGATAPKRPDETASAEGPAPQDAAQAEASQATQEAQGGPPREQGRDQRRGQRGGAERPPRQEQPMPESAFAQPYGDEEKDFAALFAETGSRSQQRLKPGSKVQARIAHLGAEVAFLDLGGKGEGIIDLRELRNDKGELLQHQGDQIDGYVLSVGEGNVVITKSVPKGAGREVLQAALEAGLPVEGLVTAQNKGGLEVDLGGMRAFCPSSQIDIRFTEDTAAFVGQKLQFRVMEMRGGNAILSRRALLEEERKGKAAELRARLEVGAQLDGVVISVRDFGAFVDLGGLEGMIHVSELSHARTVHAQDAVKVGQKVRVQVIRIDPPGKDPKDGKHHDERIALSLKALEQDPWDAARPLLEEGKKLQGKVARLQPFGAFVELFPGVDGLVHVSALSNRHVSHPREVVKEGELIWVQVESIDEAQKRVSLRRITEEEAQQEGPVAAPQRPGREPREGGGKPAGAGEASGAPKAGRARVGDIVDAKVDRVETFGVFITWSAGKGLIPNAELGTERGSDNKRTTPVGTEFKAQIIEIDERGRYRLSRTSAERAADRSDYEQYQQKQKKAGGGKGFGTLGDLLRAKLQQSSDE